MSNPSIVEVYFAPGATGWIATRVASYYSNWWCLSKGRLYFERPVSEKVEDELASMLMDRGYPGPIYLPR